jgi:hypothetical protein
LWTLSCNVGRKIRIRDRRMKFTSHHGQPFMMRGKFLGAWK